MDVKDSYMWWLAFDPDKLWVEGRRTPEWAAAVPKDDCLFLQWVCEELYQDGKVNSIVMTRIKLTNISRGELRGL